MTDMIRTMGLFLGLALLIGCTSVDISSPVQIVKPKQIVIGPQQLFLGFEASKIQPDPVNARVLLDKRVFKLNKDRQGVITTDIIDLGAISGMMGQETLVKSVRVDVAANVPEGATLVTELRSGNHSLDQKRWSDWARLPGLSSIKKGLHGRYIQLRMTLTAATVNHLPSVSNVVLTPDSEVPEGPRWQKLKVLDALVLPIVRSPIDFHYERPDHPKLAKFRKAARLDLVVDGAKDDFDALVKLMDWVGSCKNMRGTKRHYKNGAYAWDIDLVFEIKDDKPYIHGHCMSYAEVLVTAASSMGYIGSRHMAIQGFRDACHEIAEIWVPSLGKWVYFDPSLSNYYFDKKSGQPMNCIEMHNLIIDKFIPADKDMVWFTPHKSAETRARVKKVGGKKHIGCRLGPWKYGETMPPDYDWGWYHGYLANGFVQMTPRNDFHSHPEDMSHKFGDGPGYDNYPFWVDAKTPPAKNVSNWYTRMRDFYWSLDQASLSLVRNASGGTIMVELGNSMPFFKRYILTVDGNEIKRVSNPFEWQLKAGENLLEVMPIDEFGRIGRGSFVKIHCGR